jgi:hypothetical protein
LAWLEDVHDRAEQPHRSIVVGVVSAFAACVTPFGPAVWAYAVGLSANPEVTRRITEWQPTSLREGVGILFYASVLAVVALLARRGKPASWPTLAWLAVFFVIGVYAARGIAWWPLGAVAAVAGLLASDSVDGRAQLEQGGTPMIRRLNVVVVGAIVLAGVALLPIWRPVDPGLQAPRGVISNAPPGITAALRNLARPGDRLLNPQIWGSWFEFAVPSLPVAIDSRIEFFQVTVWNAYDDVTTGREGWQAQLDQWDVTIAVVAAGDGAFGQRIASLGWRTVYEDQDGSIAVAPDRSP